MLKRPAVVAEGESPSANTSSGPAAAENVAVRVVCGGVPGRSRIVGVVPPGAVISRLAFDSATGNARSRISAT